MTDLKVIGAGFGRTGTMSLKVALETIGFGPCCHMIEVTARERRAALWLQAARDEEVDWRRVLDGYQATVDWPGAAFYRELMEAYPSAKVILTVRDPDAWYESVKKTIHLRPAAGIESEDDSVATRMVRSVVWERSLKGQFADRQAAMSIFERHNREVTAVVPASKLLVFRADDGWEPLCHFLDVPVPSIPYPHLNDTRTFVEDFQTLAAAHRSSVE